MKKVRRTLKRPLALLVVILLLVTQLAVTSSAATPYTRIQPLGDGTYFSPYRISTPNHLFWFADEVNSGNTGISAVLMNSININPLYTFSERGRVTNSSGISVADDLAVTWTPIGNADNVYSGTFNGNGYTVSGMFVLVTQAGQDKGFFGRTGGGCVIENLSVSGALLFENYDNYDLEVKNIGGIVGCAVGMTTITNCTNRAHIRNATFFARYIGGIVGAVEGSDGVYVSNCSNYGVLRTQVAIDNMGGIVAYTGGKLSISYCANYAELRSSSGQQTTVGGILGYANNVNFNGLQNCFNFGEIPIYAANPKVGSIIGVLNSRSSLSGVKNNWYYSSSPSIGTNNTGETIPQNSMTKANWEQTYRGEVVWKLNGSNNNSTPEYYQTIGYLPTLDRTGDRVYNNGDSGYENYLADGTVEIRTADDLYSFATRVNGGETHLNAEVMNDIDLNPNYTFNASGIASGGSSPRAWVPIATGSVYYNGIFDGNGYTISGLYCDYGDNEAGFFRKTQ